MTYNEYAQVLEAVNPDTGELYTPDDLNVISYEELGVGMLQDAIWADGARLATSRRTSTSPPASSPRRSRDGSVPRQPRGGAEIVVAAGSQLGTAISCGR